MLNDFSRVIDSLVPITRFNKGEANKIFDEVKEGGYKIVVKNNVPACVLVAPERYQEMMELIENQYLISIAKERASSNGKTYTQKQILDEFGITQDEIDRTEVAID